jgi:hypothetical protein
MRISGRRAELRGNWQVPVSAHDSNRLTGTLRNDHRPKSVRTAGCRRGAESNELRHAKEEPAAGLARCALLHSHWSMPFGHACADNVPDMGHG